MGKASLVDDDRRSGRVFIDALRGAGIPIRAGMWLRLDDGEYKLYVASPLVEQDGPLKAYARISEVLNKLEDKASFTIDNVVAANTTNHFVNMLASLFVVRGSGALELRDVGLNDISVKHAYIYHVDDDPGHPSSGSKQKQRRATGKKKGAKQYA